MIWPKGAKDVFALVGAEAREHTLTKDAYH
jgi:hypothetical protein